MASHFRTAVSTGIYYLFGIYIAIVDLGEIFMLQQRKFTLPPDAAAIPFRQSVTINFTPSTKKNSNNNEMKTASVARKVASQTGTELKTVAYF